jgi:hypothetical protein
LLAWLLLQNVESLSMAAIIGQSVPAGEPPGIPQLCYSSD